MNATEAEKPYILKVSALSTLGTSSRTSPSCVRERVGECGSEHTFVVVLRATCGLGVLSNGCRTMGLRPKWIVQIPLVAQSNPYRKQQQHQRHRRLFEVVKIQVMFLNDKLVKAFKCQSHFCNFCVCVVCKLRHVQCSMCKLVCKLRVFHDVCTLRVSCARCVCRVHAACVVCTLHNKARNADKLHSALLTNDAVFLAPLPLVAQAFKKSTAVCRRIKANCPSAKE
jgi:hypothetical protein